VDDIAELIRYPSDFATVRENIFKAAEMASKRPLWKLKCYTVLQALNYKHLHPIWKLLSEVSRKHRVKIDWWPITLTHPQHLSLAAVPLEERLEYLPTAIEAFEKYASPEGAFTIGTGTKSVYEEGVRNMTYDPELHERLDNYLRFIKDFRQTNG
jgi:hypothetical protein